MANTDTDEFKPPPGPPPVLNYQQISHLAFQGWLHLELPGALHEQLHELFIQAATYFDLDFQEKQERYPPSQGTECGFYQVPDEKEYLTFRNEVYVDADLDKTVRSTWHAAAQLLHRILGDISRAGSYDPAAWTDIVASALELPKDNSRLDRNITLLRLFKYYPSTGCALEHVDVGLLTLCVGDATGLQVWDRMQDPPRWTDAIGPVVLVGDMTRALLRNRVRAGLHRVVGNPDGRSSIVMALRPKLDGSIDLAQFGGEGVVEARNYFYQIKGRKYNINEKKDIRAKQQRSQEEWRQRIKDGETLKLTKGQG